LHTWNKEIFEDVNRKLADLFEDFQGCNMIFQ